MDEGVIRLCVTGARSSLNLGTASIVISGLREINRRIGSAVEFVIISPNADIDLPNYKNKIPGDSLRVVGPAYSRIRPYSLRALLLLFYCLREFRHCDMVVDMRG